MTLQTRPLISDDGAFLSALQEGLRPDPVLSVSEWADRYRVLDTKSAAEAGPWRTSRTPYLKEIMDCLSGHTAVDRVVVMAGSQLGKTEAGNNWIGYVVDHAPGPMLCVQPTEALVKRFSQQRLDPLIDASDRLRLKIPPARMRDSGNTTTQKEFPGGILFLAGANSATALRSMPIRWLFMDEVDAYPGDIDGEGDPVALALARTATFGRRRKILLTSTPTIRGRSRIEREFMLTDQRRYFVPCPHCGGLQTLKWANLKWEKGKPNTAAYECEHCGDPIHEHHKAWMLRPENGACWRPTAESDDPTARGYHLSSLYSPLGWKSWPQMAQEWERAQGNVEATKAFINGALGETWVEHGDAPDWQRLDDRRDDWEPGTVPQDGLFLTAGADVQKDRIEVDVWAWGRGLRSWLIDHVVIDGTPDDPETWAALDAVLSRTWTHAGGAPLGIMRLAIDTGFASSAVYAWARRVGFANVSPVKGAEGFNRSAPVTGPTVVDVNTAGDRIRRGARLWTISTHTFKAETYRWLRLEWPSSEELSDGVPTPPGAIHLPLFIDTEWIKQLVAEQLATVRTRTGFVRLEWHKLRERNEALDMRVYARAAAWIVGADRWNEDQWKEVERPLYAPPEPVAAAPSSRAANGGPPPGDRVAPRNGGGWVRGRRGGWGGR